MGEKDTLIEPGEMSTFIEPAEMSTFIELAEMDGVCHRQTHAVFQQKETPQVPPFGERFISAGSMNG